MVSPGLHHTSALGQMLRIVVGGAHLVAGRVRQLPFDRIRMPTLLLIQQGGGHASKAVTRHHVAGVPQRSQRLVDRKRPGVTSGDLKKLCLMMHVS